MTRFTWGDHDTAVTAFTTVADVQWTGTREVRAHLVEAVQARRFLAVTGPFGVGKTFAVARACEYYRDNIEPDVQVAYLRMTGGGRDRALYQSIYVQLADHQPPGSWTVDRLRYELGILLTERPRIIVIDEFHRVKRPGQEALHELSEIVDRQCGFVIIGDTTLVAKTIGEIRSRTVHTAYMKSLDDATCATLLSGYHPLLAATDPQLGIREADLVKLGSN